jgi:hypothetical protein
MLLGARQGPRLLQEELLKDMHELVAWLTSPRNARADATTAVDSRGRYVIADRTFVEKQGIRTVFGMGGAYLDSTLVTALIFVADKIPQLQVDRFPSVISNFKMATAKLAEEGRFFSGAGSSVG